MAVIVWIVPLRGLGLDQRFFLYKLPGSGSRCPTYQAGKETPRGETTLVVLCCWWCMWCFFLKHFKKQRSTRFSRLCVFTCFMGRKKDMWPVEMVAYSGLQNDVFWKLSLTWSFLVGTFWNLGRPFCPNFYLSLLSWVFVESPWISNQKSNLNPPDSTSPSLFQKLFQALIPCKIKGFSNPKNHPIEMRVHHLKPYHPCMVYFRYMKTIKNSTIHVGRYILYMDGSSC